MRGDPAFTHRKVGVVVVGVFGLSDLHSHTRLLHELAGSEGQTAQHALTAALQHPLQNLINKRQKQPIEKKKQKKTLDKLIFKE